jgi:hypothetical protein
MRDDDQPPAGAISLSEFFERADLPLLEAQRQAEERLKAAEAGVPQRPSWFDDGPSYYTWAEPAYREHPAVRAVDQLRNEVANARRAVADERLGRLRSGDWSGWGLENSPAGRWRLLSADIWPHVRLRGGDVLLVRGNPPIEFYNVRVAPVSRADTADHAPRGAGGKRRNAQDDCLLKNRIEAVLAAAKTLWPDRGTRPPTTKMARELTRRKRHKTSRQTLYGRSCRVPINRRRVWASPSTGNDTSDLNQYQKYHWIFNRLALVAGDCSANATRTPSWPNAPHCAAAV